MTRVRSLRPSSDRLVTRHDSIGRLVKSYLEQQDGWRVLWLRSGEEAVAELRRHPVRLVVLDIELMSPHLTDPPFPVVTYRELRAALEGEEREAS